MTTAANTELEVTKRRAARESSLAIIRGYLELLKSDPLMSQIEYNPFKVRVELATLKVKLTDLSVNLMRCI